MLPGEARGESGHVTSVYRQGNRYVALGVVRKTQAKEGTTVRIAGDAGLGTITRIAPYV